MLDCGLDRKTISVLLDLIEAGVHPEALADGEILEACYLSLDMYIYIRSCFSEGHLFLMSCTFECVQLLQISGPPILSQKQ